MMNSVLLLLSSFLLQSHAEHPCEAEVQSACPDRPGSEMAACLKDKSEHDNPTEISSDCTDFIALNVACAEDITKFCDEAFFSSDTTLCLTEWTPERNLAQKCVSVLKWAAPRKENDEGPTDELGMTEKDRREKAEWRAKRKEGRSAAVEKLKDDMKAERELADLKRDDPAAYAQLMKEREEAKRSVEELKKRKRLMAAADERKRREEAGETVEETEEEKKERKREELRERRRSAMNKDKTNWLPYVLGGLAVAYVFFNVLNLFTKSKDSKDEKDD
eukprot:TRINITY_DN31856_c0_g1_i1.p1 TRINITY_DN31856_c0_g1~~TRINITY_DN31856_c0_g1_i1.p1  ORF type:complete len:301 (-),score=75.15 TRINITY_DN31856_c0_g1_i1:210-1037(-)